AGRWKERYDNLKIRAKAYKAEIIYANLIGGQDELVFDGHSLAMDKKGKLMVQGKQFSEDRVIFDRQVKNRKNLTGKIKKIPYKIKEKSKNTAQGKFSPMEEPEEIYNALMLGVKDYVEKNGFKKVVVALSGGVDSALVSCIAADALGKENISVIFMPSKFSSQESYNDAKAFGVNLKIGLKVISIQEIFDIYLKNLEPYFGDLPFDSTEENLQARIRGNIVMAFSNKFQLLVLTTGNKSEMSTGYATLYGDMAGGFAVIKDVPKTLVYKLTQWRNKSEGKIVVPERVLTKPPTAELRPDQKDTDTLPPYEVLDPILKLYVEEDKSFDEIVALNPDSPVEDTKRVIRMVDFSEYK